MNYYKAFNLLFSSEIELPELTAAESDTKPDVTIEFGQVPEHLEAPLKTGVRYESTRGAFLLNVDDVGRYLVVSGSRVVIQKLDRATDEDVRVFLLGTCLGALLQQRGGFALHASAVNINGGAVAFMGVSGIGKSTLASAFWRKGHPVLTDDVCLFGLESGWPMVLPGYPQTKLWLDILREFGMDEDQFRPIRNRVEKRAVPLDACFSLDPVPLRKIYLLHTKNTDGVELELVKPADRYVLLHRNTYRHQFLDGQPMQPVHFQLMSLLSSKIPLVRVWRQSYRISIDALVEAIEEDLASVPGSSLQPGNE